MKKIVDFIEEMLREKAAWIDYKHKESLKGVFTMNGLIVIAFAFLLYHLINLLVG